MSDDHNDFSAEYIFKWLFILTAGEVAYGYAGDWMGMGRLLLWGGLLLFAIAKGYLIMTYFMHFKYEGWIVKCLIAPTPFLIIYMLLILRPDVGNNGKMDFPVGSQFDNSVVRDHETHEIVRDEDGVALHHDTFKTVLVDMGEHDPADDEDDAGAGH